MLSDSSGMTCSPLRPDVAVGTLDNCAVSVLTFGALAGVRVVRGHMV